MSQLDAFLEKTWDALLSRNPQEILAAYQSLDSKSQHVVEEHLQKMVSQTGWHAEQIKSAAIALQTIQAAK